MIYICKNGLNKVFCSDIAAVLQPSVQQICEDQDWSTFPEIN